MQPLALEGGAEDGFHAVGAHSPPRGVEDAVEQAAAEHVAHASSALALSMAASARMRCQREGPAGAWLLQTKRSSASLIDLALIAVEQPAHRTAGGA